LNFISNSKGKKNANTHTVEKLNPRNCSNCFFWDPKPGAAEFAPQRCLRNPPTWRTSKIDPFGWFCDFPETSGDDSCGCWQRRKRATKRPVPFARQRRRQSRRVLKK